MTAKPDAITKAVDLLQLSETVPDHERRARQIREAFDLLNACLKEHPSSEYLEYIENCKQAHMRSHLKRLSVLDEPDWETWVFNFILFSTSTREANRVLEQYPELKSWYDKIEQCGEIEALSRLMVSADLQQRFKVLRDRQQLDKTFEAVVVRYPHLFRSDAVQAAQWRLDHPHDLF